jgi:hypothetical protein
MTIIEMHANGRVMLPLEIRVGLYPNAWNILAINPWAPEHIIKKPAKR